MKVLNDISCNSNEFKFISIESNSKSIEFKFNWVWIQFNWIQKHCTKFKFVTFEIPILFYFILFYLNLIELNSNSVEKKCKLMPKKIKFYSSFQLFVPMALGKKVPNKHTHIQKKHSFPFHSKHIENQNLFW
jgi:hypothetical protein